MSDVKKPRLVRRLPLIGWRETVRLPLLGVGPLTAKIDTGARTAALHAEEIAIEGRGSRKFVRFLVPVQGRVHACETPLAGHRLVKNSGGGSELRPVILTDIAIGKSRFAAEVTLTDRTDMGVPMLLGRSTIRGRYLVHPGRAFIESKPKAARPRTA
jgi:hypothetical protein